MLTYCDYPKIYNFLCSNANLLPRQNEVIQRRFGLGKNKKRETLESIGDSFGISRERVRQIEENSIRKIKNSSYYNSIKEQICKNFTNYLSEQGKIKREDILLQDLAKKQGLENYVLFFLILEKTKFQKKRATKRFFSSRLINLETFKTLKEVIDFLIVNLEKKAQLLKKEEIYKMIKNDLSYQTFNSFLEISKEILEEPYSCKFGLSAWPEISPKGIRDKAYVVLKESMKPLHFNTIAITINKRFEQKNFYCKNSRTESYTLIQTVHNELIRNDMFVLIGRGYYALKEQGYIPGTTKDIIVRFLRKEGRPLTKETIIKKVLEKRIVAQSTILNLLKNKNYFTQTKQGKFTLKRETD